MATAITQEANLPANKYDEKLLSDQYPTKGNIPYLGCLMTRPILKTISCNTITEMASHRFVLFAKAYTLRRYCSQVLPE